MVVAINEFLTCFIQICCVFLHEFVSLSNYLVCSVNLDVLVKVNLVRVEIICDGCDIFVCLVGSSSH